MEKICGIYMITSPSGKMYIGKSVNIFYRWIDYKKLKCKSQKLLYFSLKKHGVTNHIFQIIEVCDKSKLNEREVYFIDFYKTFKSEYGLNLTIGGDGGSLSFDEKFKLRQLGYNIKFRFHRHSLRQRKNMRIGIKKAKLEKSNHLTYLEPKKNIMAAGRPIKSGLDYFNIDTSIGDKVKYLIKKCKMDGYGIFVFILARIYKTEGYYCKWDDMAQTLFCDDSVELSKLKEVVSCCLEIGLFNSEIYKKYSILTSSEIQKKYIFIIHSCKRKGIVIRPELNLINSSFLGNNSDELGNISQHPKKANQII